MRKRPYTGLRDTNDFDNLNPDQAAKLMQAYRYLGEAFETSDDDDMSGRGWMIDAPLKLVEARLVRATGCGSRGSGSQKLGRGSEIEVAQAGCFCLMVL
jgi:hypothetical protein